MPRAPLVLLLAFGLAAGACAYESSGTTTTTEPAVGREPVDTSPADLVFEDQRVEGSAVVAASVSMPDDGWVVVRADQTGSPGDVLGISQLLKKGVIADVVIPFTLPLEEDQVVHATIHVDGDRDGSFTYEPPDAFIDEIATLANGDPATVSALIELLPPLEGGDVAIEEQRTDGTSLDVAMAFLPAPGFVALQRDVEGEPGEVFAVSELLLAGPAADIELALDPPLRATQKVWAVVYVDRDEDGVLDPAEGRDEVAVRDDGTLAAASAAATVVLLDPVVIVVEDQEGDGEAVVLAEVSLPAPGFIEILTDVDGEPGTVIGRSRLLVEESYTALEVGLDEPLVEDTMLWARARIDFEGDGAADPDDPVGLAEPGGEPVEVTFRFTFVEGEADAGA